MNRQDIITAIEQSLEDLKAGNITLDAFFDDICDLDGDWQEVVDVEDEVVSRVMDDTQLRTFFLTNTEADEDDSKDEVQGSVHQADELPPSKE